MDKLSLNKLYLNIEMDREQDVQPSPPPPPPQYYGIFCETKNKIKKLHKHLFVTSRFNNFQ